MVLWERRHADRQAEAGTHAIAHVRIKKHGHHTVKPGPGRDGAGATCAVARARRSWHSRAVSRSPGQRYVDPLAEVWLGAAARIGLRVERSADAYAASDGRGTLTIGSAETLDADDSLAQMIFHELCHALVAGPEAFERPDWGLDNIGDGDAWYEHATLRVQLTLARRYGLERFFAPTTDYRADFWDTLPADALADRTDPSVVAAIHGLGRVDETVRLADSVRPGSHCGHECDLVGRLHAE